jgi:nucleotide-binding universal stress UspA family protein
MPVLIGVLLQTTTLTARVVVANLVGEFAFGEEAVMNDLTASWNLQATAGTAAGPPAKRLVMVVGYDGSEPARHALEEAEDLLSDREGSLEVVYVAHMPAGAALSGAAVPQVLQGLDEEEKKLAEEVHDRLVEQDHPWHFQRRDGSVPTELMAVASDLQNHYGDTAEIAIVVGGSAHRVHHVAGGVGSSVARADRVPVLVVP